MEASRISDKSGVDVDEDSVAPFVFTGTVITCTVTDVQVRFRGEVKGTLRKRHIRVVTMSLVYCVHRRQKKRWKLRRQPGQAWTANCDLALVPRWSSGRGIRYRRWRLNLQLHRAWRRECWSGGTRRRGCRRWSGAAVVAESSGANCDRTQESLGEGNFHAGAIRHVYLARYIMRTHTDTHILFAANAVCGGRRM